MIHPEPELLAAVALEESNEAGMTSHVQECSRCQIEVSELRRVVVITASLDGESLTLEHPPSSVWSRITDVLDATTEPAVVTTESQPHRWRTAVVAATACAIGVAATLLSVAVSHTADTRPRPVTPPATIADGTLTPFASSSVTRGSAEVRQAGRARELTVTLTGAPHSAGTFVEAWLLNPRTNAMLALGVVRDRTGTFAIPDDLDLAAYTSVDVSLEPLDGNPAHSADSLARGSLTARS